MMTSMFTHRDPTRPMGIRGGLLWAFVSIMIIGPTHMKADEWVVTVTDGPAYSGSFTFDDATGVDSGWTGAGSGFSDFKDLDFAITEGGQPWIFTSFPGFLIPPLTTSGNWIEIDVVGDISKGTWVATDTTITAVPEPHSVILLSTVLLAVALVVRKRLAPSS